MALTVFQREVLQVLAQHRSPNSVFAGGATLNRNRARISEDFDIEHMAANEVDDAYRADSEALIKAGYRVVELRKSKGFAEAKVEGRTGSTLVDWMQDTAVRFFPAVEDEEFGWRLHEVDLAVNKVLALAGRREARDYFDVVSLIREGPPLSALAWAACAKDPGMTPSLILDECVRNSRFSAEEFGAAIEGVDPIDLVSLKRDFLKAVAEARDLFATLPLEHAGHLYVDETGAVAVPDAARAETGDLRLHPASVGGAWPAAVASPEMENDGGSITPR